MKGRRVVRSYSPQEKEEALRQLALNGGSLSKTAQVIGIPIPSLCRWKDEESQKSMEPYAKEIKRFIKNGWKNILALSSPKFIKQLKAKALEKGNLKDVCMAISILIRLVREETLTQLQSKASRETEPHDPEDALTDKELQRLIREEKRKLRKHKAGQDETEV